MGILDQVKDGGAKYTTVAIEVQSLVAGDAQDNVAVTGPEMDLKDYGSGKVCIYFKTTLAATKAFGMKVDMHECATSGGTFASHTVHLASSVAIASGLTTLDKGSYEIDINLTDVKRYGKLVITPYCSATSADMVRFGVGFDLLGGSPQPKTGYTG